MIASIRYLVPSSARIARPPKKRGKFIPLFAHFGVTLR